MKKILALSFALLFCSSAAFAAAKPETVITELSVKDAKTVHDAILKGCEERGWVPVKSGDNEITATLKVRTHTVVVRIPYGKKGYEIIYVSSVNMKYDPEKNTIHSKYNNWAANLDKSIKTNIDFTKELE